ncbi:hypothetical protein D9619_003898 [Psilocybe cf. subviscida]|uniref:RRM domain-containing protein n=1 Tax=Psilocybe cf. subviscida TaxID=2480587 RepID=A0A8H5BS76_9AGAR|nr:hypothetical protein D9619_003898 [Psilocybe cf. subviscida]
MPSLIMGTGPRTPKPPTSTSDNVVPLPPKKPTKRRGKCKRVQQQVQNLRRSARLIDRSSKTRAVEAAKKKDDKKRQVAQPLLRHWQPPAIPPPRCHIFIGNLESSITLDLLESFFRPCGRIRKTIIRCSRGHALNGITIPDSIRSPRDRLYASMVFYDFASVTRALQLNRAILGGAQLVVAIVSISPADMPDVADIARPPPLNNAVTAKAPPKKVGWGRLFQLTTKSPSREDTVRDLTDPKNDKIRIFGYSFDKCIL